MEGLSVLVIPVMFLGIVALAMLRRVKVFDHFIMGAKDGLETTVNILPSLIALLTAISMFRASGALELLTGLLSPLLRLARYPEELLPLALMRSVSGSASLAIVRDLLNTHGPDSFVGRVTSVMMGSTETTFYTLAVYFGAVNVKDTRYTVKAALLADLVAVIASVYVVRLFFY